MKKVALMQNPVQEYAWGSRTFIPQLLGEAVPSGSPRAELWMGAHPMAPSSISLDGVSLSLPEAIGKFPKEILGESVAERFSSTLPFLFKVLAMDRPLSIQAHPDRKRATEGFERENRRRIPLEAPQRNYRDGNHKPELLCALTPFRALKGFRRASDILSAVEGIGFGPLTGRAESLMGAGQGGGLRAFFQDLMTLDGPEREEIVAGTVASLEGYEGMDPVLEWVLRLNREFPADPGVLAPLFLNLVELRPGEAVMIRPGELHAYLEGAGLEVMANSDNVLRGGLTGKHIDVPELLTALDFTEEEAAVLVPLAVGPRELVYPAPAEEFRLSVIDLQSGDTFESPKERSVEILFALRGSARIIPSASMETTELAMGASALVPAAAGPYSLKGPGTIYRVTVPPSS